MKTLKKIIGKYMRVITWITVFVILIITACIQANNEQRRAHETALSTFAQIEQLLDKNQKELETIREEYRQTCLNNAEVIARIIEDEPDILYDIDELKNLAKKMEVDEIHLFDETGRIFTGTHPEYYGFTFDSGEQISFFKPMLDDKSLKLVQDIEPNTAEAKLMQYSAVWSDTGKFIVQVGMEPVNVMKVTEKNELSYIFSMFGVNLEAGYYAIDIETGEVVGATDADAVGKNLTEIGFTVHNISENGNGFHTYINDRYSYCVFKKAGDKYIGCVVAGRVLYQQIPYNMAILAVCLAIIAFILIYAVTRCMNKYVVDGIQNINNKLAMIAEGNFEEKIDIHSSAEFSKLSRYINIMVKSIVNNTKNMSYVLRKTNMHIGVYEYIEYLKPVHYTELVPKLLMLDEEQAEKLSSDNRLFKKYIDEIFQNPVFGEEGVYKLEGPTTQYIRIEEVVESDRVFGVLIDVTDEINRRLKMQVERDIDSLTGLYNRYGLDARLSDLFKDPEKLGFGAVIMIDADDLKVINDTYGHETGDMYLKKIAEIIQGINPHNSVSARPGGDEFVLFLYGYPSKEELTATFSTLREIQDNSIAELNDNIRISIRFSFGFSMIDGSTDYQSLIKEADENMYKNKRSRKKNNYANTDNEI